MSETPQNPAPDADQPTPDANQPEPAGQTWGAPPTSTPRWSWRKTVIAAAVALGIAGAGGAAVWAASTAAGEHANGGGGPMLRVAGGPMGGGMPLHGESVMKGEDGDYFTQVTQTGEVTALSDTSITARSEDGYTKTYVITDDTTLESVEVGDEVMVVARLEADTATAETVFDTSEMMKAGPGPGPGKPGVDHHPGDRPDRGDR